MELKQLYNNEMTTCINMALATCIDGKPNVRVVTFAYESESEDKLYFTTFKGNKKVKEFTQNPHVACMPLPEGPEAGAQVRIFGQVQKSSKTLDEMIALVGKKTPENAATLKEGGPMLEIYEVLVDEAWLTIGMNEAVPYTVQR